MRVPVVHRNAPELQHIQMQRSKHNFQDCSTCANCNASVTSALKSHNAQRIAEAKAKRAAHIADERGERLCYYDRIARSQSSDTTESCLSIILDKWDSAKTTCPFFATSPGHWWTSTSHDVLDQHVLGLLAHVPGGKEPFLYTFNSTISGDANANIEGIRRLLVHKCV